MAYNETEHRKRVEENRRQLRTRIKADLKAAGLPFRTLAPPTKIEPVIEVEPTVRVEDGGSNSVRIRYREICGVRTELRLTLGVVQQGEHLILSLDRDKWMILGTTAQASGKTSRIVDNKLLVPLPVGADAVTAVMNIIDKAVSVAIQKL